MKDKEFPQYTGLKDFLRGVKKLYKMHGNIPVFLTVDHNIVAPLGIAVQWGELLGGDAIVLMGGHPGYPKSFKKGSVTK